MGVIWGLGSGGIWLVFGVILGCFLVRKLLLMEWCFLLVFCLIIYIYFVV